MKDITKWFGVQPTEPEQVFTQYEQPYGTTLVNKYGFVENDTLTIYTVAANKILYVTDFGISVYTLGVGGFGTIAIFSDVPTMLVMLSYLDCAADVGNSVVGNLSIAWKCVEGDYVRLHSQAANIRTYAWFTGYTRNV